MSLARAMTKRIRRTESTEQMSSPKRNHSMKNIDRSKISLPVSLISTTNTLVYDAPDISSMKHSQPSPMSIMTQLSGDDSDRSVSGKSRTSSEGSTRDTFTDASSVGSSPTSPAPNHLSGYFPSPTIASKQLRKAASTSSMRQVKEEPTEPVPEIPTRAFSHSKRAHVQLAQKRSMQNLPSRSSQGSQRSSREQRQSLDMFKATITEETHEIHPFGRELEQLNEAVEEFSGVAHCAETVQDMSVMKARNLATFCAADYLAEIAPLFSCRFGAPTAAPMAWI